MKKIISMLLLFALLLSAMAILSACDEAEPPASTTATTTTITTGEQEDSNGTKKPSATTDPDDPEDPSLPTIPDDFSFSLSKKDWGGEECVILGHSEESSPQFANLEIWRDTPSNDVISKAVWSRNRILKNEFNFEVKQKLVKNVKSEITDIMGSSQDLYDICIYRPFDAAKHAEEEYLLDLSMVDYIDLEHESWDQNATAQLSIANSVYFTVSDFLIQDKDRTEVLFYNREMARQANKGYLEDKVKSGDWTVEYFGTLVKEFSKDGNGNHLLGDYKDDGTGDYFGLGVPSYDSFATFVFGAGIKLSYIDEDGNIIINNNHSNTANIIDALGAFLFDTTQSLYVNDLKPVDYIATLKGFGYSKVMFSVDVLSTLDRIHEGKPISELVEFEYSVLPFPKYESGTDTWYTSTSSGTTGAVVAIPATVVDSAKSGFFLQALSEASTHTSLPAYLTSRIDLMNADTLTAEMLDIIFSTVRYDIAAMYDMGKLYTMLSGFGQIKRNNFERGFPQRYVTAVMAAETLMDKFAQSTQFN